MGSLLTTREHARLRFCDDLEYEHSGSALIASYPQAFTSSFRPEFYSTLGVAWVNDLLVAPKLAGELAHVVTAFDPWARDRGEYYSLAWKPRTGAARDAAFKP